MNESLLIKVDIQNNTDVSFFAVNQLTLYQI
jgi:hypothetical protein